MGSGLWRRLASPIAATILAALPAFLIGTLAVQVQAELEFSEVRLGALVFLFAITGVVTSPVLGRLADRGGERIGTLVSASLVAVAMTVAAAAGSWGVLAFAYIVAGVGNAAAHPSANLALSNRIPEDRQGLAFGIKQASIPTAIFLAGVAVPLVGLTVGWRWAYAAAGLGALVLVLVTRRSPAVIGEAASDPPGRPRQVGGLFLVSSAALCAIAGVQCVTTFLVVFAVETGIGPGTAGLILAASSVLGISVRIASGWMADRVPGRSVLLILASYMTLGAVGLWLIAFAGSFLTLALGTLVAIGAGWSWNGLMHFSVVRSYPEAPATATSILQAGLLAGAATGPLAFGFLVGVGSFQTAWSVAGAFLLIGALLSVAGWRVLLPRQIAADRRRAGA